MNKYGPDDSFVFKEEENVLKPHWSKPEGKLSKHKDKKTNFSCGCEVKSLKLLYKHPAQQSSDSLIVKLTVSMKTKLFISYATE